MQRAAPIDPPADCVLCQRLVAYRRENEKAYPDYFNGPAPSFGPPDAALLIVGLAPGLHGANRTGRPFTGDFAGALLYSTLAKFGFSNDRFAADPDDGLALVDAVIANAVRCAPPKNKPVGAEIKTCRQFLERRIRSMKNLRAILCLGRVSHEASVAALGLRQRAAPFAHGAQHRLPDTSIRLFDSYHCSRYNTNTGRLTAAMFEEVFAAIRAFLKAAEDGAAQCAPP